MDVVRKRIGIVGGGQLSKMMILEAKRLGFYVVTLDPAKDCPSHSISDEHIVAEFDDPRAYVQLAKKVDVITYEFEHIHAKVLEDLEQKGHLIYPSVTSLKVIQNKYTQNKRLFENDIPVPRFALVDGPESIKRLGAPDKFGYPIMLKSTLGGYDGKGNALVMDENDCEWAYNLLGGNKREIMAEEYVNYSREISIIACRGIDGSRVIYPAAENSHRNSILDTTIVPARVSDAAVKNATKIADKVMEVFEGVGTFCVEMFVVNDDKVLVNEIAPRPHNSGHYTIEGCLANQFENHIRAITGLPFGSVELIKPSVMVNLLGENDGVAQLIGLHEAYKDPNLHVHFYGKGESKQWRKMGHFTVVDDTVKGALERAERAKNIVKIIGV
ncbi:MAG: 5-(carboxyamino)imidazole ribonucleotide synthase [Oscillospiraceae bacterium]|nr:5-(carboxyamino)imidazole ribonucleotide synthase [Oscillospiraceae bacterium]